MRASEQCLKCRWFQYALCRYVEWVSDSGSEKCVKMAETCTEKCE